MLAAHIFPVRPKPVIISSAMSSAPCSVGDLAHRGQEFVGGGMTLPAVPCIGSMMIAAISPAVSFLSRLRRSSAQAMPQDG